VLNRNRAQRNTETAVFISTSAHQYGAFMEPSRRKRWQTMTKRNGPRRPEQAETIAVGCDELPRGAHGKERVYRHLPAVAETPLSEREGVDSPTLAVVWASRERERPYRPQTNGKAERFIRTLLASWARGAIYRSSAERPPRLTAGSGTTTIDADPQRSATDPGQQNQRARVLQLATDRDHQDNNHADHQEQHRDRGWAE
jgi:hypothetical protein